MWVSYPFENLLPVGKSLYFLRKPLLRRVFGILESKQEVTKIASLINYSVPVRTDHLFFTGDRGGWGQGGAVEGGGGGGAFSGIDFFLLLSN